MRRAQRTATHVFGYAIERQHDYDEHGSIRATRYEVRCPRTGAVLGHLASLRMAKRFVVTHELREFSAQDKRERFDQEMRAA